MRFVLRTLGIWLLLLAMVAAVVDATKSLAGGGAWAVTPLGEQWRQLFPEMLSVMMFLDTVKQFIGEAR